MKNRFIFITAILFCFSALAFGQVDSFIGQITSSETDNFVRDVSGDGRFVVMESIGNIATENPRNADGNREIFLFDYAQRRIFQITDTKSLLTDTALAPIFSNIKVEITNSRPVISTDGKWIAFSSNATTATPTAPNSTNPGNFDANSFTVSGNNVLTQNGNTEVWLYELPAVSPADLSIGSEIPLTNLAAGTFTLVTNSLPNRLPVAGTNATAPIISDDNRDISISDDGGVLAFVSNRDLVPGGNAGADNNPEIFSYVRSLGMVKQVSQTPRGTILDPTFNVTTALSGNGSRVAFVSNGHNPIIGMTGGSNDGTNRNEEIFFSDLDATGAPAGTRKQVTATRPTNPGDVTNSLSPGKRMSRDGRYIAFETAADLTNTNGGTNHTTLASFLFDSTATTNVFKQLGPRGNADSGAPEGDVLRFPTFSDYTGTIPATVVLTTRLNIKADGTVPATASEGLNNVAGRPAQVYAYTIADQTFKRLTTLPASIGIIPAIQPIPSNSIARIAFNLASTEVGTRNTDLRPEGYYLFTPSINSRPRATMNFATGASNIPVSPSPLPTPSPTATPTPSPTPSPTPTPTPTPTPQTPAAVHGVSPGMLAIVNIISNAPSLVVPRSVTGSNSRRFPLPMELSGVSMSVNGAACGLKSVSNRQIMFLVPPGLTSGSSYPLVINLNGVLVKGEVTIVPTRPDVFTWDLAFPGPGGRAKTQNVTNRVFTTEPFTTRTLKYKNTPTDQLLQGTKLIPSRIRLYLTGVQDVLSGFITIRLRDRELLVPNILNNPQPTDIPGEYYVDFIMPVELRDAGDVPLVFSITGGGVTYNARLDDTAPKINVVH